MYILTKENAQSNLFSFILLIHLTLHLIDRDWTKVHATWLVRFVFEMYVETNFYRIPIEPFYDKAQWSYTKTTNLKIRQWNIWLSVGYSMWVIKDLIFFGKKKLRKGLECASDARSISFHYHRFFHAPYQSLGEEANKTFNFFRV